MEGAKPYRLSCKSVHLTFKTHLNHQQLIDHVKKPPSATKGLSFKWFSVCHHQGDTDTPYPHTHIAFETVDRFNIVNPRFWDVNRGVASNSSEFDIHPHIQRINNLHHAATIYENYHRKDDALVGAPTQSDVGPMSFSTEVERLKVSGFMTLVL